MNISTSGKGNRAATMTLLALETLPCGCVAGVYQARPTVVEVEFVEAKGPHCVGGVQDVLTFQKATDGSLADRQSPQN